MAIPAQHAAALRPKMAVFDFDETLVRGKTMFEFLTYFYAQDFGPAVGTLRAHAEIDRLRALAESRSRATVNREFYRLFKGQPKAKIETTAAQWFQETNRPDFYHQEILDLYRRHQADGAQMVVLSGSASLFLAPFANHLGVDHLLAINLEVDADGILTGEIQGIQTIGDGKRDALEALLAQSDSPVELFGYGDHQSDFPFLEICDHPAVILSSAAEWRTPIPPKFEQIAVF